MARIANCVIEIRWDYKDNKPTVSQISLDPLLNEGTDDWIDNPESLQDMVYNKLCELEGIKDAE